MNIESVATNLSRLAKKIKADKGPLELLGLFLRDDSPDLWDLVVSAPWLKADERTSFEYIAGQLRGALAREELAGLSRIVILDHGGAVLNAFLTQFANRTGLTDVHYVAEGGAIIRQIYIIVASPLVAGGSQKKPKKPRQRKASSPRPSQSRGGAPRSSSKKP